ncbi:MAG: glycerol-3-phosphate dehydrogenase C-terminal domain-containing protein [Verrucomicrobiota bacterium]
MLAGYGADAIGIQALIDHEPALARTLDSALPYVEAEVTWAVRCELARSVEDILARRLRALFLNARAAVRMAPRVAELMARELGRDSSWRAMQLREFEQVAEGFLVKAA